MKQINFKCSFKNAMLLFALMYFISIGLNAQNTKKTNVLIIWETTLELQIKNT